MQRVRRWREEETWIRTRTSKESRGRKVAGRAPSSTSSPDKYEGSEQSDQDGPGESNNGDEECVELDLQSHALLRVTATSSISRVLRLAVDVSHRLTTS